MGAIVFDPYRIAYASYLPFGSGLSEHRSDTRADTAAWVAECKEGGPIALAWAQALDLAPEANRDVIAQLTADAPATAQPER
ncbi:hypothetical protein ACQPW1_10140 [Nocardia sp. CA-128927]|uniref:hypothetical protein n=1 Tax=Nocardia sp. CA-128927 TaxID=3239975 RepID=UPI003D99FA67